MYNAFISYSHAADDMFAPSLQNALQKFAKPWYKKRNLEIFRDESSLSASPHLWNNITQALDQSEYLILLASPESENSKWVNKEIEYWLDHKSIDNILIALTDGSLEWDAENNCFLNPDNNSLPPALDDKFASEPFYIDLRQSKTEKDLSLDNSIFKKEILKLAAKLHDKTPNDLASEEVTVHRKMILLRNAAVSILVLLLISFTGAAWYATIQRNQAQANYLSSEAKTVVASDPTLALRLAEESMKLHNNDETVSFATNILRENSFYKIIIQNKAISKIEFSPDGKTLLAGGMDSTVCLYDLKGNIIQKFKQIQRSEAFTFSPDGNRILTAYAPNIARIWDLKGNSVQDFIWDTLSISSAFFSSNGKMIITISNVGAACLWDINGKRLKEILYSGSLAFSSNKDVILTVSDDGKARLLNLDGILQKEFTLSLNKKIIETVSYTPSGTQFITKATEKSGITSVALSPDGKTFLTGHEDGTARLWDLKGNNIQIFQGHTLGISCVAFSPDGQTILTGSYDKTARLWALNGNSIQLFKGHNDWVINVAFSPDGKNIVTCCVGDSNTRLWGLKLITLRKFDLPDDETVRFVIFSPDGKKVLTTFDSGFGILWDQEGNKLKDFGSDFDLFFPHVVFSPNGKTILSLINDKVLLLDLEDNVVLELKIDNNKIDKNSYHPDYSVTFSPDGKKILAYAEGVAIMWDLKGKLIKKFEGINSKVVLISVAISPDGKIILASYTDSTVRMLDMEGNIIQQFKQQDKVSAAAFSPDGKTILLRTERGFSSEKPLYLLNLNGEFVCKFSIPFLPERNAIISAVFSPNGKTILTHSYDKIIRFWDIKGNIIQELLEINFLNISASRLENETGYWAYYFQSLAFSHDGEKVLAGSVGHTAIMWATPMTLDNFLRYGNFEPLTILQKKHYGIK